MKTRYLIFFTFLLSSCFTGISQNFSTEAYIDFRNTTKDISTEQLENMFARSSETYFRGFENTLSFSQVNFLDSARIKLELTPDELHLLKQNLFVVTERLSFRNFGQAFHTVYNHDLPVFITTDAILHALHMSYNQILKNLEREVMADNLEVFLQSLYKNFGEIHKKYGNTKSLSVGLYDADVFITIAYSLISDKLLEPNYADADKIREIWEAINAEKMVEMPLFTYPERNRKLDFSQFTVRGHYVYTEQEKWQGLKSLEPYFRTMMWLGRMDFLLTPPPSNPWEKDWEDDEIHRMHYGAFMLNELLQNSDQLSLLEFNEKIIDYLVGESDNVTPRQYQNILEKTGIISAEQLTNTETFLKLKEAFNSDPELGQKILSDFFLMDPQGDEPGILPISYRVSGQRFIIDSYILGNVVFDRLVHNGKKIMRMMPKPLDILFPLGNNDVLPLLKPEIEEYPYAGQMANLRYIVDNKKPEFWTSSLYNVWLNSIRELNPTAEKEKLPLFMQTAAWHQEKMNTQLASWSQLRHDNLLYAKQSYTGGTGCSFPQSFVEPYPGFYKTLQEFTANAGDFFEQLPVTNPMLNQVIQFFPRFEGIMVKLEELARKQLEGMPFTENENEWLQSMLFNQGGSGIPPYTGWYTDLFFDKWDVAEGDFTVVDVHTQPTDEAGNVVGKVLHTGTGKVNLGVFLANCSQTSTQLTAFVGPTMSYYEKITDNFKRLTDQEWEDFVYDDHLPQRPDWTNIYLAGEKGEMKEKGAMLPVKLYTGINDISSPVQQISAYPNPVNRILSISLSASESSEATISVFNSTGIKVKTEETAHLFSGNNTIQVSFDGLSEGLYVVKVEPENGSSSVIKVLKK